MKCRMSWFGAILEDVSMVYLDEELNSFYFLLLQGILS